MKTLKFNEGGQPVFLDDLHTIQNEVKVGTSFCGTFLTASKRGVAIKRDNGKTGDEWDNTLRYQVGAHKIVVDDNIYDFEAMATKVESLNSLYYHIRTTSDNMRRMADGQTKYCTEERIGFLSTNSAEDGVPGIPYASIPDLSEAIKESVGLNDWEDVSGITLVNGWQGTVCTKKCDGYTKVKIKLGCTGAVWQGDPTWHSGNVNFEDVFTWTQECPLRALLERHTTYSQGLCGDDTLSDRGYLEFSDSGCHIEFENTPSYAPNYAILNFIFDVIS